MRSQLHFNGGALTQKLETKPSRDSVSTFQTWEYEDVVPARSMPKSGRFEFALQPQSGASRRLLADRAELNMLSDIIIIDLPDDFWTWFRGADASLISQAYIDGTYLSGEHWSASADLGALLNNDNTESIRSFAQRKCQSFHLEQRKHVFGYFVRPSQTLLEDYAERTKMSTRFGEKTFDFKEDFAVYKRSLNFVLTLHAISGLGTNDKRNLALQKAIATNKSHLQSLAIAVKRLEMACKSRDRGLSKTWSER